MEEDVYFKCCVCENSFEADSESMVSVEYSGYLIHNEKTFPAVDLEWEGSFEYLPNFKSTSTVLKVVCPVEFSNTAICICPKCREFFLSNPIEGNK
jgi:hypothetical protein